MAFALRAAAGSVGKMEETSIGLLAKLDQVLPDRLRKRASALHSVTLSLASAQACRRWTCSRASRPRAATNQGEAQLQGSGRQGHHHARSSRCGSPTRAAAGTSWRGIRSGRTGARSGWTASSAWSPRSAVRAAQVSRGHRGVRQAIHPSRGVSLSHAPASQGALESSAKAGAGWCGTLEAEERNCTLSTGADRWRTSRR